MTEGKMSLEQVRNQIRAFATHKPRNAERANYYMEMNVLLMDDWWKAINAHLASQTSNAHELWAAAQLAPGEGIEDGVARIEALLSQPAEQPRDEVAPDPKLCSFYNVSTWADLVAAQEEHVLKLQDAARRNVKPYDDTFPPTLLPKYLRGVADTSVVRLYASQPNAATDAQVDDLAAALTQCADGLLDEDGHSSLWIAERLYELAALHATAHPAPSQAVGAVDARGWFEHIKHELSVKTFHGNNNDECWRIDMRRFVERCIEALALPSADQPVATAGDGVTEGARDARFYLRWALARLDEVGLTEFAVVDQQVFDEAENYLASPSAPRVGVPEERKASLYPDESRDDQALAAAYDRGWNDCRKAMLASAPEVPNP